MSKQDPLCSARGCCWVAYACPVPWHKKRWQRVIHWILGARSVLTLGWF